MWTKDEPQGKVLQHAFDCFKEKAGVTVSKAMCEHFGYTRQELFDIVRVTGATSFQEVLASHGDRDLLLHAQSHLAGWYGRFGFAVSGPEFLEDDIPHLPMLRPGS